MTRLRLPIGIQTFREIREEGYYYFDKTGFALQQIKDKGYANKHRAVGQPLHLIGVEFSREQRGVVGFEVETLLAG
jgi:hypothetical protein